MPEDIPLTLLPVHERFLPLKALLYSSILHVFYIIAEKRVEQATWFDMLQLGSPSSLQMDVIGIGRSQPVGKPGRVTYLSDLIGGG